MSSTSTGTAPGMTAVARPRRRRSSVRLLTAAVAVLATMLTTTPAAAASAQGPDGQQVTVSRSSGLNPAGETITVSGSGFDTSKGIYVALCVDNGAGAQPSPCLGGVDMEGAGGASAWISSNPPAYGEGLAVPFTESGGRGSFSVALSVAASDAFTDCLDPDVAPNGCVIGTRADHTRAGDRSADVRVPVTFATGGAGSTGAAGATGDSAAATGGSSDTTDGNLASTGATVALAAAVAVLLVVIGAVAVVLRRRSIHPTRV